MVDCHIEWRKEYGKGEWTAATLDDAARGCGMNGVGKQEGNMGMTKYILVASGNITCPTLNINLHTIDADGANESAKKIAIRLSRADYFQFTVFCGDIEISRLTVEESDPTASVTLA